jgi:hypothetical protein
MDGAWLHRMRWRRRGAWLWPAFAIAVLADALIGHALPQSGETQTALAAGLAGFVLNLIGVVLLSRPLGALLRRRRTDMPPVVARDYGGTAVVVAITSALLLAGVLHRPSVLAHRKALADAIARAQAWIGDRAPAEFRRNVELVSTAVIEAGSIYRICVPSARGNRTYCVVVKTNMPFERSVSFAGYESNAAFSAGTG